MLYTSSELAKILRRLNDDKETLIQKEEMSSTFLAASGEDADSLRPEYDYAETGKQIAGIDGKVRAIKHALNIFNSTHKLPGYDMTVDQALVYIPQLSERRRRLAEMKNRLPKMREGGMRTSNVIDYRYTNYDPAAAQADFDAVSAELSSIQTALDLFNTTEKLELDIVL